MLICISYFLHCSIFKVHSLSFQLILEPGPKAFLFYTECFHLSSIIFDFIRNLFDRPSFGSRSRECLCTIASRSPFVNTFLHRFWRNFATSKSCILPSAQRTICGVFPAVFPLLFVQNVLPEKLQQDKLVAVLLQMNPCVIFFSFFPFQTDRRRSAAWRAGRELHSESRWLKDQSAPARLSSPCQTSNL